MKLKLTQPGYETYTGLLGDVTFTNGTSDADVSAESAAGIAAVMRCDQVDSGTDTGGNDVTADATLVNDTAGDFNAATTPAPTDPV